MRTVFQGQLAAIEKQVGAGLDLAIETLEDVATCALATSAPTPSSIERTAEELRGSYRGLCEVIVTTIARQAPVAGDLRLMLVLMEIAHHTGLIANQFDLINAQLMETDPDIPDRLETGKKLAQMARLAASELAGAATALHRRDSAMAGRVAIDDATINALNREVFATTLLSGDDEHAREVSMRHVLIARSLERVGDNAVDIAEQVMFLVTGEVSHPEAGRDTS